MNHKQRSRWIGLLATLEGAAVAKSWAGTLDPRDAASVHADYLQARAAVELFVDALEIQRSRSAATADRLSRQLTPRDAQP